MLTYLFACIGDQNALYLPFQAAIYEMQSTSTSAMATTPAAARYVDR